MIRIAALLLATGLAACGSDGSGWSICEKGDRADNGCGECTCKSGRWKCPVTTCPDLRFKAGFVELEPVTFSLRLGPDSLTTTSSRARIWYAFQPADQTPEDKPLLVVFNGGPGSATSGLLFAFNTAKRSLDPQFNGGVSVGPNPTAWTRFANLLYVDARGAGFSYGLMDEPLYTDARQAEFSTRNFNTFLDGADFVRVILRFLAQHPAIQANPVHIVGESYGGVRATVLLHLLLNYRDYGDDQGIYQDVALAEEIQTHLDGLHPELAGQAVEPGVIAQQFSHQILIQPLLSGWNTWNVKAEMYEQPDSVIYQIAAEEGLAFVPCSEQGEDCNPVRNANDFVTGPANRDIYNYVEQNGWTIETAEAVGASLVMTEVLSAALGMQVTTIAPLAAEGREGAYRLGDPDLLEAGAAGLRYAQATFALRSRLPQGPFLSTGQALMAEGDLEEVLGEIPAWDAYYVFGNEYVLNSFYSDDALLFGILPGDDRFGRMFLDNVVHVETFVSHAAHDLAVYSAAQPRALGLHVDILAGSEHDTDPRPDVARPGWVHLDYLPQAGGHQRTIRFPYYAESGHVIEIDEPAALMDDLIEWLSAGR